MTRCENLRGQNVVPIWRAKLSCREILSRIALSADLKRHFVIRNEDAKRHAYWFLFHASVPLQDLLRFGVQGSMLSQAKSGSGGKRKWQHALTEGPDTECTPTELIQQWSPGLKRQHSGWKGKENDGKPFAISRRPRKRKESELGKKEEFGAFQSVLFLNAFSQRVDWSSIRFFFKRFILVCFVTKRNDIPWSEPLSPVSGHAVKLQTNPFKINRKASGVTVVENSINSFVKHKI